MEDGPQPAHLFVGGVRGGEERQRELEQQVAQLQQERAALLFELESVKMNASDYMHDLSCQGRRLMQMIEERNRYLSQVRRFMRAFIYKHINIEVHYRVATQPRRPAESGAGSCFVTGRGLYRWIR